MRLKEKSIWGDFFHLFLERKQESFQRERGQDLIEFALVLPLLFIFLFGALDLGRAFFSYIAITNAAREGARYAVSYGFEFDDNDAYVPHTLEIIDAARREAQASGVNLSSANVQISCPPDPDCNSALAVSGDVIKVSVELPFQPILAGFLPDPVIQMEQAVQMIIP